MTKIRPAAVDRVTSQESSPATRPGAAAPLRVLRGLLAVALLVGLYVGLNQPESRAIYAAWDKLLHATVFYLAWWLLRALTPLLAWPLAGLLALAGGLEEIHQLFLPGHQADWQDWLADIAGLATALLSAQAFTTLRHAATRGRRLGQWLIWPYTATLTASFIASLAVLAVALGWWPKEAKASTRGVDAIEHVVVIYAENRSFDHLFGLFPGAEGVAQATPQQGVQVDAAGAALPALPGFSRPGESGYLPGGLPNGPFRIDLPPVSRGMGELLPSPVHAFWQNQTQIAGGENNRFVAVSDAGGWVMGYWDGSPLKLWQWAREYTLADHFFMGAFGGSFLNHQWLICACTPRFAEAPGHLRPQTVTSDGYVANMMQPPFQPSGIPPAAGADKRWADARQWPLPPQTATTIGDTLSAAGVSWAWFGDGWAAASADGEQAPEARRAVIYNAQPGALAFQPHHQPFNYYARFAPGSPDRARHLKDSADFFVAMDAGNLPAVSFYKPAGRANYHPATSSLLEADAHLDAVLQRLRASPQWPRMAVFVAYDENGGFWDHVPPPKGDRWGPGNRVPAIIVSPWAKRGFVDKTPYDTTSILKFITWRFKLPPLPGVRPEAGDFRGAFEF